eukprot:5564575-Prymnesium_polylepis.1
MITRKGISVNASAGVELVVVGEPTAVAGRAVRSRSHGRGERSELVPVESGGSTGLRAALRARSPGRPRV